MPQVVQEAERAKTAKSALDTAVTTETVAPAARKWYTDSSKTGEDMAHTPAERAAAAAKAASTEERLDAEAALFTEANEALENLEIKGDNNEMVRHSCLCDPQNTTYDSS